MANQPETDGEILTLRENHELQFGVFEPGEEVSLQVLDGSAEIYGSPLNLDQVYRFVYYSSLAVFSRNRCSVKVKSSGRFRYRIRPSEGAALVWECLDWLRASACNGHPTITLITGPTDVGKSTLCRYLLNLSARREQKPIFVDLDVGQSSLATPGTMGVLPIHGPSDAYGKFNERSMSVYFFGYKSPGHNMPLYKALVQRMSFRLRQRLNDFRYSGVIVDTCGWIDGPGYNLVLDIIDFLKVNSVLVVGSNHHYNQLKKDLPESTDLKNVPHIEGVSFRNKTVRRSNRDSCLHEYFYGLSGSLKPHTFHVLFTELNVFQAKKISGHNFYLNAYELQTDVVRIPIDLSLLHQVFGLSYASQVKDVLLSSVYGFVCFIGIEMDSEKVHLLSPQPPPLPSTMLIMGDLEFKPREFERSEVS